MARLLEIPEPRPERPRRQTLLASPLGEIDLRATFPFPAAEEVPLLHLSGAAVINRIDHFFEVELTPAVDGQHMVVQEKCLQRRAEAWRSPTDNAQAHFRQALDELGLWLNEWLAQNGQWLYEERLARLEDEADFLAADVQELSVKLSSSLELLDAHEAEIGRRCGTSAPAPVGVRQRLSQLGA